MSRARAMVERVRAHCRADPGLVAALTYGSVPQGLDDDFSDAEFWVFGTYGDPAAWITAACGPSNHLVDNEFGALVALLPGGFRCEFHLRPADAVTDVLLWPARGAAVPDMVLLDRTGELTAALQTLPLHAPPEDAAMIGGRFANWWLLGWNVLQRGEYERSRDALAHVRRHLLWLARLRHRATDRWLTPSRLAERDLPAADLDRLRELDAVPLRQGYAAAWAIGLEWGAAQADPRDPADPRASGNTRAPGVPAAVAADVQRLLEGSART